MWTEAVENVATLKLEKKPKLEKKQKKKKTTLKKLYFFLKSPT